MEKENLVHPIAPVFDENSKILILGSFPSKKSRDCSFFYGHPQNRFWKILSKVFSEEIPDGAETKKKFLISHGIALWDVIACCEISGSADSSIKNAVPNDITRILDCADIRAIFVNGKTSEKYYKKYIEKKVGKTAVCLPSTSPANAAWSLDKLAEKWLIITDFLK